MKVCDFFVAYQVRLCNFLGSSYEGTHEGVSFFGGLSIQVLSFFWIEVIFQIQL